MTYEELIAAYEFQKKRADEAEAKATKIDGELKAERKQAADRAAAAKSERESATLHAALRGAGVPEKVARHAATVLRGESEMLHFKEDGSFDFASFGGRTFRDASELAKGFVERFPNFSQAHIEAAERAQGGGSFDNMSAVELAELGLQQNQARPPSSGAPPKQGDFDRMSAEELLEHGLGGRPGEGVSRGEAPKGGNGIVDQIAKGLEKAS